MVRRIAVSLALVTSALAAGLPAAAAITPTSATVLWTAPGDDSLSGTAAVYDVRLSTSPLTDANFSAATAVPGPPSPLVAGSAQSMVIGGLVPSTGYWVAIKTADERGNWSGISNIVSFVTPASTDSIRPATPAVALGSTTASSVALSWTAVGDDSLTGTADHYELRWNTSPVNPLNWSSSTSVTTGVPTPAAPGTSQGVTVSGLDRSADLYFALRVVDEAGNASAIASAPVVPHLLDATPPAAPASLNAAWEAGSVRVRWSANGEPDLSGYRVWRAITAGGTFSQLNGSLVTANEYLDTTAPDSASLWYQVSAVDLSGNEGPRSAIFRLWRDGVPSLAVRMQPVYPNPSALASPVTLPIELPAGGPFDGRLEILDAGGQRLRTIELRGLVTGTVSISWDGRNDAGRLGAPGVYRALLHLGGATQLVQFVRKP